MVNPRMPEEHTLSLGQTAEAVARRGGITREEQDRFALLSHQRAVAAQDACHFQEELEPVPRSAGEAVLRDEGPRRDTTLEKLAALKPAFEAEGTVTAGNSSPLNDGAACLLLASAGRAQALGRKPLARVVAAASAGLDLDPARVNPNGGAIALGHPLGASGARILTSLVHELARRGGRYGLATMCIGVGQGIALVVESLA